VTVLPAVYRMAGAPETWEQWLMAGCLWAGPPAVVSHRAAATLWRLTELEDPRVEIITPRRLVHPLVAVHRNALSKREVTQIGPIPVTDPSRTLLDLAATADPAMVERALDESLRRKLTTLPKLGRRMRSLAGPGRRGSRLLCRLLTERDPRAAPPESELEARVARLLAASTLPPPVAQYEVRDGGRVLARLDFAWPEAMVALEADGFRHHGGAAAWRRDLGRGNLLVSLGWQVLHVTWQDVTGQPDAIVEALRRTLFGAGISLREAGSPKRVG